MRAVVWHGPRDVRLEQVPDPDLEGPRDAIVRVTKTAICGTDLHPYRGEIEDFRRETVLGHEFTGVVEAVGSTSGGLRPGDRVLASDVIACGACWACERGWHYQCDEVSLFGYGEVVGRYVPGGQAELVRVPNADVVLSRVPDGVTDEQILFVGDILSTGHAATAQVKPGDEVAVVGCGPVGLCSLMSARVRGAKTLIAVDGDPARRAMAETLGAVAVAPADDAPARVAELCAGRGPDVVVEAVGTADALRSAVALVRACGTVTVVGAHGDDASPFAAREAFAKEITVRFAVGNPIAARDELVGLLASGALDPTVIVSHRVPLADAVEAYAAFDRREAVKVVMTPS